MYRSYTPSTDEVEDLVNSMRRTGIRLATLLAWKTGARLDGVRSLRWKDIEQTPHGWLVQVDDKTGLRRVPISREVAEEILSFKPDVAEAGDRMFSLTPRLGDRLISAQERRGIPYEQQFTFHGLRRRWSLDQIGAGVPVSVYADISGHSPEVALEHYARVSDADRQAALLRVEELYAPLLVAA